MWVVLSELLEMKTVEKWGSWADKMAEYLETEKFDVKAVTMVACKADW